MIHFLQCLWWEWRWRRLKSARSLILATLPLVGPEVDRIILIDKAHDLEREMDRLSALMSGGGR